MKQSHLLLVLVFRCFETRPERLYLHAKDGAEFVGVGHVSLFFFLLLCLLRLTLLPWLRSRLQAKNVAYSKLNGNVDGKVQRMILYLRKGFDVESIFVPHLAS